MDKIINKIKYIISLGFLIPAISYAQGLVQLLTSFKGILGLLPRIIFGLCVIYFFWGTAQFIQNAGNEKLRGDAKNKMIWGVVAIFVFISIGGILYGLGQLLNISTSITP